MVSTTTKSCHQQVVATRERSEPVLADGEMDRAL